MSDFKKDILKDVKRIQEEMDLLFDHFYRTRHSPVLTAKRLWRPPTDVFETESEVVILSEVAGMKRSDFSISLSNNILTLKGERKEESCQSRTHYRNMEINYGMFERNIYLPEDVDPNGISANYRNGYLEIKVQKKKRKKGKEIKIE
jgi:HSP20 family protein